jgi:uncharacterized membrane protein
MASIEETSTELGSAVRPGTFRRAVLRGLGVVLPPLLTVVLLIWGWNIIEANILRPIETGLRQALVLGLNDTKRALPEGGQLLDPAVPGAGFIYSGKTYVPDPTGRQFLPDYVVSYVDSELDRLGAYDESPGTASAYWHRYVELKFLPRVLTLPLFLVGFITALYFLGKIFAHGIGRWFVNRFEAGIGRIPLINKVYGSVKQVTDLAFNEREIQLSRVVMVEYPRKGIWSIGFVTGSGLPGLAELLGEPVLSILMPTSPMPMTGFAITVRRSEVIDLDMTIDDAIQFCVSCGVVVPQPKGFSKKVGGVKVIPPEPALSANRSSD